MPDKSRKQQFIEEIEYRILSGQWRPGDKIPTERELVKRFSTSRTVVNAALSELAQKGFLVINPRQWTKVADYMTEGKLEVLYSLFRHNGGRTDTALVQGVLDARCVIETESARLAALNRTDADIDALQAIIDAEQNAVTLEQKTDIDYRFHHMLCIASHNPVYPLMMNSFEPIAKKYIRLFYSIIETNEKVNTAHRDILDAIKNKKMDIAVAAVKALLGEGEDVIKTYGGISHE